MDKRCKLPSWTTKGVFFEPTIIIIQIDCKVGFKYVKLDPFCPHWRCSPWQVEGKQLQAKQIKLDLGLNNGDIEKNDTAYLIFGEAEKLIPAADELDLHYSCHVTA